MAEYFDSNAHVDQLIRRRMAAEGLSGGPSQDWNDSYRNAQQMRARAMELMAGQGAPSWQTLYAGAQPAITRGFHQESDASGRQLASRGMSFSGVAKGQQRRLGQDYARDLASAEMGAKQEADSTRRSMYDQGLGMYGQAGDTMQSLQNQEYARKERQRALADDEKYSGRGVATRIGGAITDTLFGTQAYRGGTAESKHFYGR